MQKINDLVVFEIRVFLHIMEKNLKCQVHQDTKFNAGLQTNSNSKII